jgi:ribulose-phosphate 3-epimerase
MIEESVVIPEVIPGILEQEWENIEKKIEAARPFAKSIHIDLLDGVFAPNKTWIDPEPFKKFTQDFTFELHMMVDNPVHIIDSWADAGFTRFIGQVEKMPDIAGFVAHVEQFGEVGLAVDSDTSVETISPFLEDLDFAFVMTVKAGFSNQSFLPEMIEKVKQIRAQDSLLPIEVDGGISDENIVMAKEAGATRFVSTGFLFNKGDSPEKQYQTLCSLVK